MKKINYISILAIVLLFSCSKEQPLAPVSSTPTNDIQSLAIPVTVDGSDTNPIISVSNDDITDPDKKDKEKTNKKAKN